MATKKTNWQSINGVILLLVALVAVNHIRHVESVSGGFNVGEVRKVIPITFS